MEPRRVLRGVGVMLKCSVIDFKTVVLHSYSCDADQIYGKDSSLKKQLEQGQRVRPFLPQRTTFWRRQSKQDR